MSTLPAAKTQANATPSISFFERYLTVWVVLCIVAGIFLGQLLPALARTVGSVELARVNLPVGVLIWIMIIPMLMKVDFAAMGEVRQHLRGIAVTHGPNINQDDVAELAVGLMIATLRQFTLGER